MNLLSEKRFGYLKSFSRSEYLYKNHLVIIRSYYLGNHGDWNAYFFPVQFWDELENFL